MVVDLEEWDWSIRDAAAEYAREGDQAGRDVRIERFSMMLESNIHNLGHSYINIALADGSGFMGGFESMRDPIFWRWHGITSQMELFIYPDLFFRTH